MKKTVLVTGASGALGKAVVEKFMALEFAVTAIVSEGKSAEFSSTGMSAVESDLTHEEKTTHAVRTVLAQQKTLDAAVLLVGGYASGGISDTDGGLLRKMYSLNFETAWFVIRPVFLQMLQQPSGGRIILVGARPALRAKDAKKSVAYSLSKSLLFKLAEILNEEGAAKNVVTTVVVPSTIDTPANRKSMPDADANTWVKPAEIADIIALASDTGNVLRESVLKVYGRA